MIECIKWKSVSKGSLQGFADIYIPKWGIEIYGLSLHMKDGKRWINFPSKDVKGEDGTTKYFPHLRFKDKMHMEEFSKRCKEAIEKKCGEMPQEGHIHHQEELPF